MTSKAHYVINVKCIIVEPIDHLLFRCTSLCSIRNTLWNNVLQNCPSETLRSELQCMPDSHIATFLLSGLHNTYIPEWYSLYEAIASFIYNVYKERLKLDLEQWHKRNGHYILHNIIYLYLIYSINIVSVQSLTCMQLITICKYVVFYNIFNIYAVLYACYKL